MAKNPADAATSGGLLVIFVGIAVMQVAAKTAAPLWNEVRRASERDPSIKRDLIGVRIAQAAQLWRKQ